MLTEATTAVDAAGIDLVPRAVMWTITQVAARDGISKQAVSKRARALAEQHGLSVDRDGQNRILRLSVAEYDFLRGKLDDPSKAQRPGPRHEPPPDKIEPNESYNEALRQKTWHEAEKRRLELKELKGALVRVDAVKDARRRCGEEIARIIDRLPMAADTLAASVTRDGSHGARVALKHLAHRMRTEIAAALDNLAQRSAAFGGEEAA